MVVVKKAGCDSRNSIQSLQDILGWIISISLSQALSGNDRKCKIGRIISISLSQALSGNDRKCKMGRFAGVYTRLVFQMVLEYQK